jgi:hypothetical protein
MTNSERKVDVVSKLNVLIKSEAKEKHVESQLEKNLPAI